MSAPIPQHALGGAGGDGDREPRVVSIGDDLLQDILSRLPASSFAFAASTCRAFRRVCARVLCRPKLLSALSLNPTLDNAVEEVLEKLLSEPIRPHFVIVYVGRRFKLKRAHELITRRFGKGIPIISRMARGIIGCDAGSDEFKEVRWEEEEYGGGGKSYNLKKNVYRGILVILGFVPGLKVKVIPLIKANKKSEKGHLVDSFLSNIKDFTASVSGSTSPLGIMMVTDYYFGLRSAYNFDMRSVVKKMDIALGEETIIVGDEGSSFIFSNGDSNGFNAFGGGRQLHQRDTLDAVALVFAKDKCKTHGIGDIHFSLALSVALSPMGPSYRAASVRVQEGLSQYFTSLTARREGSLERLDGQRILDDVENWHTGVRNYGDQLYCGVLKQRKSGSKVGKGKTIAYLNFHEITNGDEEQLFVEGDGITLADAFRIYAPSLKAVIESRRIIHKNFEEWKIAGTPSWNSAANSNINRKDKVFGGLMFTCYGRGDPFFGELKADTSAFLANFPNIPLAGIYCSGEIARGYSTEMKNDEEQYPGRCLVHAYSTVYLIMSRAI